LTTCHNDQETKANIVNYIIWGDATEVHVTTRQSAPGHHGPSDWQIGEPRLLWGGVLNNSHTLQYVLGVNRVSPSGRSCLVISWVSAGISPLDNGAVDLPASVEVSLDVPCSSSTCCVVSAAVSDALECPRFLLFLLGGILSILQDDS